MMLKISDNRRFLTRTDGTPFFYLGDTAWELLHRCTLEESGRYLADRAAKRFTVIQSEHVHDEPWLDFHTCQSGHARNAAN